jgi:hypothetical protein
MIVDYDPRLSSVDRFDEWYLQNTIEFLAAWRERNSIFRHCEPLRADLHTNLPITVKEYDWF